MRRIFRIILFLIIGYYVTEWWLNQQQNEPSSRLVPTPAKPKAQPPNKVVDSLSVLDGIGPVFEHALNAIGIYSFAQLAEQDADQLAARLAGVRITAARIKKDRWIEQAAERAASAIASGTRWSANDGKSS